MVESTPASSGSVWMAELTCSISIPGRKAQVLHCGLQLPCPRHRNPSHRPTVREGQQQVGRRRRPGSYPQETYCLVGRIKKYTYQSRTVVRARGHWREQKVSVRGDRAWQHLAWQEGESQPVVFSLVVYRTV